MREKLKKVYYCDFCKKHSLRSIKIHEDSCTLNPNRVCRACKNWSDNKKGINSVKRYYQTLMSHKGKDGGGINGTFCREFGDKIKLLSEKTGCPFCMLAILRQSGIELSWANYNYKEEVDKYWEIRDEEENREDYY